MDNCLINSDGVGNFYLINSKKLQIGIGIGKFSRTYSEELHIGKILGNGSLKGIEIGIGKEINSK